MMKNILDKFKSLKLVTKIVFFITIFFYILITLVCTIKVNYTLDTPGSLLNATSLVSVTDENYNNKPGNIYGTCVYTYNRITIIKYLLAKNNDKFVLEPYEKGVNLTDEEDQKAGELQMKISQAKAIIAAYALASTTDENIKISYSFNGARVISLKHVDPLNNELCIGDYISEINGIKITNEESLDEAVSSITSKEIDDRKVSCVISHDNSEFINTYIPIYEKDGNYYLSINFDTEYVINEEETFPKFTIKSTNVGGPSAGFMQTLAIYNMLTSTDLTNGYNIAGTGTIEINDDGTSESGRIGCVKQKIYTASLVSNLDYFFVDPSDYAEALEAYNTLKDPHFKLVSVSTLNDVITCLSKGGNE